MTDFEKTLSNLKMAAVELPELTKEIPDIIDNFIMVEFGCYTDLTKDDIELGECKTYGCGLGNISRLFNPLNPKYYNDNEEFDYNLFYEEEFPCLGCKWNGVKAWNYLFSSDWYYYQNSNFDSFIKRIVNLINYAIKNKTFSIKRFSYETNEIIE